MAITANHQSALPPWDETIVPALRKRLEGESRILAERMSIASITSIDEAASTSFHSVNESVMREHIPYPYPHQSSDSRKISAIPRPSIQQSRLASDGRSEISVNSARTNGVSSPRTPYKRSRTYSQSYVYDTPQPNGHNSVALPTPDSSRPTSPRMSDVKPTRIPVAAQGRATSGSSHTPSVMTRSDSRIGNTPYHPPTPETSPDLWAVKEDPLPSKHSLQRKQGSGLLNELPLFDPNSLSSSIVSKRYDHAHEDPSPVRRSTDSEERPYEHLYRGDIRRNGGVGELRVGKRVEMLEIANYGHNLRKASRGHTQWAPLAEAGPKRKRADSVAGVGSRESFYLDDDRAREVAMVFDENPLTDVENDEDDMSDYMDSYHYNLADSNAFSSSTPMLVGGTTRSETPTTHMSTLTRQDVTPTRIPVARQPSEPVRSETPTRKSRGSESRPSISISTSSRTRVSSRPTSPVRSATHPPPPHSQTQNGNQKPRAKSPATATPSAASKKKKPKPPPRRNVEKDAGRQSIGEYPAPVGDDVMDAIPSWTQPVPKSGNWDEVVLPVVARKKGLDSQYEQATGSPRPKPSPSNVFEPAPGTFGYDHSKYRTPHGEDIPMDDFGQTTLTNPPQELDENEDEDVTVTEAEPEQIAEVTPPAPLTPKDTRKIASKPPDSPQPLSQHQPPEQVQPVGIPSITVTKPSLDLTREGEDDDEYTGCCQCVIM